MSTGITVADGQERFGFMLAPSVWDQAAAGKRGRLSTGSFSFKMRLDLFEGFALRLREQERDHQEIHQRERREEEKHGRVAMPGDEGKKDGSQRGGNKLVDQERNAHAVGADARRHELRER